MVVVMKSTATQEDIEGVKKEMETYGLNMMVSHGDDYTILGAEGNAAAVDQEKISLLSGVERVMRVSEPYKMANRKYHPAEYGNRCGRREDRRQKARCHRRSLQRGKRGADCRHCPSG